MHGLFFAGLVFSGGLGMLYPGLARYDALLGAPSLPPRAPSRKPLLESHSPRASIPVCTIDRRDENRYTGEQIILS